MKTTLLTAVAALALSLGAVSAKADTSADFTGVTIEKNSSIAQTSCFYQYRYVYNGYGYIYQYRYICY